jgi:hypothetical protein
MRDLQAEELKLVYGGVRGKPKEEKKRKGEKEAKLKKPKLPKL